MRPSPNYSPARILLLTLIAILLIACSIIPTSQQSKDVETAVAATLESQTTQPAESGEGCDICALEHAGQVELASPTLTNAQTETCMMTVNADTPAYFYPDQSAEVFGTFSPGIEALAMVRLEEGWVGFDPGVAQAGNTGLKRLRWVQADDRLVLDCLDTLEVLTLNDISAEVSFDPVEPQTSAPEGWLHYNSPAGWYFIYPTELTLEVREKGFIVLLSDPNNPQAVDFSIDDRWEVTLDELKADVPNYAVKTTFTDLSHYGQAGFLVEGEVGPGYGQGLPVYTAYFELGDKRLSLTCGTKDCDKYTFGMMLRLFGNN